MGKHQRVAVSSIGEPITIDFRGEIIADRDGTKRGSAIGSGEATGSNRL
jgi:hypothetical protein